ncbi:MAG TPA: DUF4307 domain-containing protein [Nocardioides sp.]|nr:DUF4307 domain-containing protein [Nocardioides sp.]
MSSEVTLSDRYGAPAPWRRRVLVAGSVVVALAFGVWLGWTTLNHSTPDVESELIGFETVDEHTSTAVVEVDFGSDDVVATCLLQALAEDHSVVGELSFTASPDDGRRYEESVRTERLATSVDLVGCTTPDQSRPR